MAAAACEPSKSVARAWNPNFSHSDRERYLHHPTYYHQFCNSRDEIWNSLSNFVVSAETINAFKNRLDKFWSDQDVLFDYKADLHDIGNRSIIY